MLFEITHGFVLSSRLLCTNQFPDNYFLLLVSVVTYFVLAIVVVVVEYKCSSSIVSI